MTARNGPMHDGAMDSVLDNADLVALVVASLPLPDVVLAALRVDRAMRAVARAYLDRLWPTVRRLLVSPFALSPRDILLGPENRMLDLCPMLRTFRRVRPHIVRRGVNAAGMSGVVDAVDGVDGVVALAVAIASGALPELETLNLSYIRLGDRRAGALFEALVARGAAGWALAGCRHLLLHGNDIGDEGVRTLSAALTKGALPGLTLLTLHGNAFGDVGCAALAGACARMAAPLRTLYVDRGPRGTEHPALKAACETRGFRLGCA